MRYDEEGQYRYPETQEGLLDLPEGTLVYVHSLQEVTQILEVGTIDDKVFYKISVPLRETWTRCLLNSRKLAVRTSMFLCQLRAYTLATALA